jgi:uncharacterized membrane protein YdcZ (DUF606 family)
MLQAMNPYLIFPIAIGLSVVLQGTFNREMAMNFGLASAVLLNAAVFLLVSIALFAVGKFSPQFLPDFIQPRSSDAPFSLVYLLPGIFGFFIVLGVPWSLEKLGPSDTFLFLIISQILLSILLEAYRSQNLPAGMKMTGAALVILGGVLVAKS